MFSAKSAAPKLNKSGFKLVRDVLRTAGLRGVESEASSDMKRDASIFLAAEFRNGIRTKSGLTDALIRRNRSSTAGARFAPVSKNGAIDRWQDEGGR